MMELLRSVTERKIESQSSLRSVMFQPKMELVPERRNGNVVPVHSGPTLGKMPDGPKIFEPLEEV